MIEKELFSHYSIDEKKLLAYGFQPEGHMLVYSQDLEAENFRIIMTYDRALCGKIIDLAFGEEYVNFRMESATGYSAEIRNQFEALLLDIRDKCCKNQYFQSGHARRINEFIYDATFWKMFDPKEMEIAFLSQALEGEELTILSKQNKNEISLAAIHSDGKIASVAMFRNS